MKKFMLLLIMAISVIFANAQTKDTSYWKFGGVTSLAFSQTGFKYWSSGGSNAANINGLVNAFANYKKGKVSWNNTLDMGYGTQKALALPFRKTDDKIELSSIYGRQAFGDFYFAGLLDFKTQFTNGFEYLQNGDSNLISGLMTPGYLMYSIGLNYIPDADFSIYGSFLTGRTTFVFNDSLSQIGAFGVDTGKHARYEFGASIKMVLNKKITDNFTLGVNTTLFSNYLKNPQNVDLDFNLMANYKVFKGFSITFQTQMIYDDDILILLDPNTGKKGKRLQIKELFGLGLTYSF